MKGEREKARTEQPEGFGWNNGRSTWHTKDQDYMEMKNEDDVSVGGQF